MVRAFGPTNAAENVPPTATERAFGNRVVREGIVRATAPHLLPTLARVNRAFYDDTHLPTVWARQYAPARVDWASRTVFSALPARLTGRHAFAYELEGRGPKDLRRPLGRCAGQSWHLILGRGEDLRFCARTVQILEEVRRLYPLGRPRWLPEDITVEEVEARLLREDRLRASAFLRDRLYRLEHGLYVPIYSKDGREALFVGLSIVLMYVGIFNSAIGAQKANGTHISATSAPAILAAIAALVGVAAACIVYPPHGDPALRNALLGPFDYLKLNRGAHEFAALETAAKPAASPGEP